jgi:copper chaperone
MPDTITVEGMSCGGCEDAVETALRAVPGVTDAEADRDRAVAEIEGEADPATLVAAVEDAGYEATT